MTFFKHTIVFRYIFLIIFSLILISPSLSAQNPFLSKPKTKANANQIAINKVPVFNGIMKRIIPIQRKLNNNISLLSMKIKTDKKYVFMLIFFSFIYGLVHAIGPGHGKFIISSYFLSNKAKTTEAAISGFVIAFTHGISAIVIILFIFLILQVPVLKSLANTTKIVSRLSYSTIALIGLFLFLKTIKEAKTKKSDHSHNSTFSKNKSFNLPEFIPLSFITGLVPCPGAATIILFSISTGAFFVGISAIFAMSFGMGIMISLFAIAALYAQKGLLKALTSKEIFQNRITFSLRLFGTFLVFLMGLGLLILAY